LREWYRKQVAYATGIKEEPTRGPRDLWEGFNNWVSVHVVQLRKVICPNIDDIRAAKLAADAVFIISELIRYEEFIGPVTETACLLSMYGAERLCQTYEP
jgi:hypothetical protein